MPRNYKQVYLLVREAQNAGYNSTKEDMVLDFTSQRTNSLRDLTDVEFIVFVKSLKKMSNSTNVVNDKGDKMRKAIIAIFKSMGKTTQNAIDWAEKNGCKGQKKPFNQYTNGDLYILIQNAEKAKKDFIKKVSKSV